MSDLFLGLSVNGWTILAAAVVTYFTRISGHLILSRFERLHPRVEVALDAVPAAVITAIVVPAVLTGGWAEILTIIVAIIASLRLSVIYVFLIGWLTIVLLRYLGL